MVWRLQLDEDLSRLQSKYTGELPKGGKDPDEEVADKCWELHKKRNDSVIQDIFGGQVKSTVRSPSPPFPDPLRNTLRNTAGGAQQLRSLGCWVVP